MLPIHISNLWVFLGCTQSSEARLHYSAPLSSQFITAGILYLWMSGNCTRWWLRGNENDCEVRKIKCTASKWRHHMQKPWKYMKIRKKNLDKAPNRHSKLFERNTTNHGWLENTGKITKSLVPKWHFRSGFVQPHRFHLYPGAAGPHFLFGLTGNPTIHHKTMLWDKTDIVFIDNRKKDRTEKR